jgi:hypothetical protein
MGITCPNQVFYDLLVDVQDISAKKSGILYLFGRSTEYLC